ncbi:MAG: haloacid dehalogenase-like hydrolase [Solobacterium sp.]|nr:haloacid dehalogenase-like hydrolase [Solobacterium sp.]MBR3343219.1 haloacid dehalogenase-like hydrolase [Solobacterium sp.]
MKKTAILYDFDKTLCTKDMQEYSLIPSLGYKEPSQFWKEVGKLSRQSQMDGVSAYLYWLVRKYEEQGRPLRREDFADVGRSIEFYRGVDTWFRRINEYGASLGLEIEHYVISSGMAEIIEASGIADEFRRIYACRYYYDENGTARWPAQIINYTTKTQYIFRINKQVLDESDDESLNAWVPQEQRPIPFSRMVYIADGLTDVPCMKLVKEYGGKSIVVYNPESAKAGITASRLIRENRADFMSVADYRESHDLETLVKLILDHMAADSRLEDLEGRYR